jgi:cysteine-rich repeat protein
MTERFTENMRIRRTLAGLLAIVIGFAIQPILPVAAAGPPPNDNRANPRILTNGHVITASLRGSTTEPTDFPRPTEEGGGPFTQTVWFQITVPVRSQVSWYAAPVGGNTVTSILSKVVSSGPSGPVLEEISHCSVGGYCPPAVDGGFVPAGTTLMLMVGGGFSLDQQREFRLRFEVASDIDGDSKTIYEDNCPQVANPLQEDTDAGGRIAGDGLGDACEPLAGAAPANDHFADATLVEADPFAILAIAKMTTRNATITLGEDDQPGAIMVDPFIVDHPANVASVWFKVPVATPLPDPSWGCCNSFVTKLPNPINGFTYYQVTRSQPTVDVVRVQFSDGNLGDTDGDGWNDVDDNCVDIANPQQEDNDLDGIGNACDPTPGELIVNDDPDTATTITIGARGPAPIAAPSYNGSVAGAIADTSVPGFTGTAVWYRIAIPTTSAYEFELPRAFVDGGGSLRAFASDGVEPINVGSFDAADQFAPRLTSTKAIYSVPVYGTTTLFLAVVAPPSSASPQTFTLQGYSKFNRDALGSHIEEFTAIPPNFSWLYSTAGATRQAGEPGHGGAATGASVWQTFVFPTLGAIQFDVQVVADHRGLVDSSTPRRVNIYQGPAGTTDPSTLTTVPGTSQSVPSVTAAVVQPCQTYYVAIDTDAPGVPVSLESRFTSYGDPIIDCHANDNDNPSGAFPITVGSRGPSPTVGTQINGTVENATPDPGVSGLVGSAVWFKWTVPATGIYEFELPKPFIDSGGGFTVFASDGPTGNITSFAGRTSRQPLNPLNVGGKSIFGYPAYAGETLYLAVARTSAFQSVLPFTLEGFKTFFNDDVADAPLRTATPAANAIHLLESTVGAGRQTGEPEHNGSPTGASVWEAFRFQQAGSLQLTSLVLSDNNVVDPDTQVNLNAYSGPLGLTDPAGLVPAVAGTGSIIVPIARCQTYYLAIDTATPGVPLQLNGGFYADPASAPFNCDNTSTNDVSIAIPSTGSVIEGTQSAANEIIVPVTLAAPATTAVTIQYNTIAGTATSSDFGLGGVSSVVIPLGASSAMIHVAITPDSILEPNESFQLSLNSATGSNLNPTFTNATATITIADDDTPIPMTSSTANIWTYEGDDTGTLFSSPRGMAIVGGNLTVGDASGNIFQLDPSVTRIATSTSASFWSLVNDLDGSLIASDPSSGLYRVTGTVVTPITAAGQAEPLQAAVDAAGNIFWADNRHQILRRDKVSGAISRIAGNPIGQDGFSADGTLAINAKIAFAWGLAIEPDGSALYFSELYNNRVRRVDLGTGVLSTVSTRIAGPAQLLLHGSALYVHEIDGGRRIIKIANPSVSNGSAEVIAGSTFGFSGDGGLATAAQLRSSGGMAIDAAGNLFISDTANGRIRVVGAQPGPRVAIVSPNDAANFAAPSVEVRFVANNETSTTCKVDGGTATPCTSPYNTGALSDGAHTVMVTAIRGALTRTATVTFNVNVDASIVLTLTGGPSVANPAVTIRPAFTFTTSSLRPVTTTCAIDGGSPLTCTSPFTSPPVLNGPHTLVVTANNSVVTVSASRPFTVNANPLKITAGPRNPIPSRIVTPTFAFALSAGAQGLPTECAVDAGTYATCAGSFTASALNEGAHTFHVRVLSGSQVLASLDRPFLVQTTVDTNDPPAWTLPGSEVEGWFSVDTDREGRVYLSSVSCNVYRLNNDGTLTNIVDTALRPNGCVFPAAASNSQLAFDSQGNAYVAGWDGFAETWLGTHGSGEGIFKVTPAGVVSQFSLRGVYGVAVDSHDNVYFHEGAGMVYRITPSGTETFVSGIPDQMLTMSFDGQDNLYVNTVRNSFGSTIGSVQKVSPSGVVSTIALPLVSFGIAVDSAGNIFTASGYRIDATTGATKKLTGVNGATGPCDGRAASTTTADPLKPPNHVAIDSQHNIYLNLNYLYLTAGQTGPGICMIEGGQNAVVNHTPVAVNDIATVAQGGSVSVAVLGNDSGLEDAPITISAVTVPAHGTATILSNAVVYAPTGGYTGVDNFTYTVRDADGQTATGTVTVTVSAPLTLTVTPTVSVTEGNSGTTLSTFTVTRSGDVTGSLALPYRVSGGTATSGVDYVSLSGRLNFVPGQLSKTVDVVINGDTVVEPDETFTFTVATYIVGNGFVEGPEECDDGNLVNGDGCDGGLITRNPQTGVLPAPITAIGVGTIVNDDGVTAAADSFMPVAPVRLLDTRPTPMAPGGLRTVQVTGVAGVPVGATAVALNVAAVTPVHAGHLRVFPTGGAVPTASVLNFGAGKNTPNQVIVPVGVDGSVTVYAGDTTNVIVDINGYFVGDGSRNQYVPVASPTRIQVPSLLPGAQAGTSAAATAPSSIDVTVLGAGGIPASGVSAVLVNVGALNPTAAGHLRVYSTGDPLPDSSTHNFSAGDSRMNLVLVRPGVDGQITVYNAAGGPVTVTVDTVGYFQSGGQGFTPVSPIRAIDTREAAFGDTTPVAPGGFREVQIRGFAGIPVGAKNVVINVAAVKPLGSGSIDVGPSGSNPSLPSFMHPAGENVANLVVVPIGADGKIRIVNNSAATSHVIADITGYFRE